MTAEVRTDAFHIRLADIVIRIEPMYDYIRQYCRDYLTDEPERFTVRITPADIAYEREKTQEGSMINFSDAYLETLAVYRKIAEKLLEYDTLLFHGSVIAVDGVGYLFTAKSGTGKSTHTRLWREYFGDRAVMINDDKPLLKLTDEGIQVYGTPWDGKHRLSSNISVPLKAITVLTRAQENHITRELSRNVYPVLLQQVYRPKDAQRLQKTMKLVDSLMEKTEFYLLGCNMEPEAAVVAYMGMNGGKL